MSLVRFESFHRRLECTRTQFGFAKRACAEPVCSCDRLDPASYRIQKASSISVCHTPR